MNRKFTFNLTVVLVFSHNFQSSGEENLIDAILYWNNMIQSNLPMVFNKSSSIWCKAVRVNKIKAFKCKTKSKSHCMKRQIFGIFSVCTHEHKQKYQFVKHLEMKQWSCIFVIEFITFYDQIYSIPLVYLWPSPKVYRCEIISLNNYVIEQQTNKSI